MATKMDSSSSERLRSVGLVDIKKDDAIDLFQTMLRSRPLPTVTDFNRVLGLVARSRHHYHVLGLCRRMELQGIAYDLDTLNIMIKSLRRRRQISSAFAVFGKILKLGYKPDSETFNTLYSVLSLEGRVLEAVEFVDCMILSQHVPNLIILDSLVNRLCLSGNASEAVALIDRMVKHGCQPAAFTYCPIFNRMCKAGNTALALDLLLT
ncbi:hypothetical protein F2Q69_00063470 [Brassica cretica]|uniref:Pentacotripeptide-repeat region of PRORP domain-containing protein n=1 Tax=Brassica cretica TaxID=69181 RepID=A0A8S9RLR6_BRACR|nr:hypothetical protein F2Q69_00063470 [Brassica cretica]